MATLRRISLELQGLKRDDPFVCQLRRKIRPTLLDLCESEYVNEIVRRGRQNTVLGRQILVTFGTLSTNFKYFFD